MKITRSQVAQVVREEIQNLIKEKSLMPIDDYVIEEAEYQGKKVELGKVNQEIQKLKERIAELKNDIELGFGSQNKLVAEGAKAREVQFYSYFYQGKLDHIERCENLIHGLKIEYDKKLLEVNKVHGELKVIEKLREKDFESYRKGIVKKKDLELEDIIRMRDLHKRRGESA